MGVPMVSTHGCYARRKFGSAIFYPTLILPTLNRIKRKKISVQVRATGAMDLTLRQPVKGRKRGGAIRVGEMERDCLISHGAAYNLKDRLLDCSDISQVSSKSFLSSLLTSY